MAARAEVVVDHGNGRGKVKHRPGADMGVVVNPDCARQQAEGSLIMGLGHSLTGEVDFMGGGPGPP